MSEVAGRVSSVVLVALVAVLLTGCGGSPNTDPRKGWVDVDGGISKKCDGSTLVYEINRGGNVVPNSPECAS